MEFGLDIISKFISTCTSCRYSRSRDCGFVEPSVIEEEPEGLTLDDYERMTEKELDNLNARMNGNPCSEQLTHNQLRDAIENELGKINIELSPAQAKKIVSQCYELVERCRRFSESGDEGINMYVSDAVNVVLSYLDLRGLEQGKDFIKELELYPYGYTRDRGLFRYCPEAIAESYLADIHTSKMENNPGNPSLKETSTGQAIDLDTCPPIENLIDQIGRYKIACIKETFDDSINWEYLDGKNKERFVNQLKELNSLPPELYERTILYIWDKLITTYNGISSILLKLDESESLYYGLLSAEQELISYIGAAYLHATFRPKDFCYRSIINKVGKELTGLGGLELLRRSADYCGISYELMLRYRNSQCEKCRVTECIGRVCEKHGILELVGPHCDKFLFGEDIDEETTEELTPKESDAIEQFKTIYGEECAENYVHSVIAMMGYYPEMTFRKLKKPWPWCKEAYLNPFNFKCPTELEESLIKLIFDKVKQSMNDEKELEAFVFSLISPFDGLCNSLFPKADDGMYVDGAIALHNYSMDDSPSLDKFKEKWELSVGEARKISREQGLSDMEYRWVLNTAIQEKKGIMPSALGNSDIRKINDIYDGLNFYATIIEAALLRYGASQDIFRYMRNSNVFLTDFIDKSEVGAVMGMNDEQVSTLVNRYGHTLSATSDDVFSIAIENFEPSREIDTTSISKSEFRQKFHEKIEANGSGIVLAKATIDEEHTVSNEDNAQTTGTLDMGINKNNCNNPIVITDDLKQYLSAFVQEGYLDQDYHWIRIKGHTLYHAGWMARVIKSNVPDVTYGRIEYIIGCKGLIDAASKCFMQDKKTKIAEIEAVCTAHGLSKKTC